MPWWGHAIVLTLILGSTAVSVVTGNPLWALLCVPLAWFVGLVLSTPRWRRTAATAARNRYVWLLTAGMLFATLAATVATVVAR